MIFSEIRAQAWKYGALAAGVLAVALLIACLFCWNRWISAGARADAAEQRAKASEAVAKALSEAMARDIASDKATAEALTAMGNQAAATNERMGRLEARTHDRPPVPAVCPGPDPEFLRESQEAAGRIRSAETGLRNLRPAKGGNP